MKKQFINPKIEFVSLLTDRSIMTEQIFLSGNTFSNDGINFIDSNVKNDYNFWSQKQQTLIK